MKQFPRNRAATVISEDEVKPGRQPAGRVMVLFVVVMLGSGGRVLAQLATASSKDSALFSAVVRAIAERSGQLGIRVDPRPLSVDRYTLLVSSDALLPAPVAVVAWRRAALAALGIEGVDAIATGQNDRCPGIFAGFTSVDSVSARAHVHDGCPHERFLSVAIGLGRQGKARGPNGEVYLDTQEAAEGYWAVRVAQTDIGPGGATMNAYDYVMRPTPCGWEFVKAVWLFITE